MWYRKLCFVGPIDGDSIRNLPPKINIEHKLKKEIFRENTTNEVEEEAVCDMHDKIDPVSNVTKINEKEKKRKKTLISHDIY